MDSIEFTVSAVFTNCVLEASQVLMLTMTELRSKADKWIGYGLLRVEESHDPALPLVPQTVELMSENLRPMRSCEMFSQLDTGNESSCKRSALLGPETE